MAPRAKLVVAAIAAAALAAGIAAQVFPGPPDEGEKPALGLFTSLPIYWAESDGLEAALDANGPMHWARTALEQDNRLVPLDTLEPEQVAGLTRLILAQPRPLAPSENVALDDWVRGGGRLLLFADPLLTEHSEFAIGDRRRPEDVVVLSPILARWGLELQFDEDQPAGERTDDVFGASVAVHLAGTLAKRPTDAPSECALSSDRLAADCMIGKGRVLIVADAAMLENDRVDAAPLAALVARLAR